jgi:hypothetical protein
MGFGTRMASCTHSAIGRLKVIDVVCYDVEYSLVIRLKALGIFTILIIIVVAIGLLFNFVGSKQNNCILLCCAFCNITKEF